MNATALTDLEQRLAAPDGPAVRDALILQAKALQARLQARMAAGLSRTDFPAWQAAANAAAAAQEVLAAYPLPPPNASQALPQAAAIPKLPS